MATVRKNQKTMTAQEKQEFLDTLQGLIDSGEYGKLVSIHGNMSHQMHGSDMMGNPDPVGIQRFLPWHRDFLRKLEAKLGGMGVPYWDWQHDRTIPGFLKSFKPSVPMPGGEPTIHVTRYPKKGGHKLPSNAAVNAALAQTTYTDFTEALEDAHNLVHMWAGGIHGLNEVGTMGNIMISPADPVFWLHHSNIDRLWSVWQGGHAGLGPQLSGKHKTMDPWSENVTALASITTLGYSYGP
jgi:tyrosinase